MINILFVCTGNTCRSPMAEAIASKELTGAKITSRGVNVYASLAASENAIAVMRDIYGLDISSHVSRSVTEEDIRCADIILAMTAAHKLALLKRYSVPGISAKLYTLAEYATGEPGEISDPFGGSLADYTECAAQISELIKLCTERINAL